MNYSKDLLITEDFTIKEALKVIDKGTKRIAIVVDDSNRLLGTLNDGDIRRALLNEKTLETKIVDVYHKKPSVCSIYDTKETIIKTAIKNKVYQIPIVDSENKLVEVEDLATLLSSQSKKIKSSLWQED